MAPIPHPTSASSLVHSLVVANPSVLHARTLQPSLDTLEPAAIATGASDLVKRQGIQVIPSFYRDQNAGPQPGTVAGIVIGTVGGAVLLLFLIYTVSNLVFGSKTAVVEEEIIRRRSISRSRSPSARRRSESRSEVVEIRRPERRRSERIIVEETTRRSTAPEDDIIEVIEEHSPAPRRKSRRESSGYRVVDPAELGGGSRPMRKVRR